MGRSIKKGPFIDGHLLDKITKANGKRDCSGELMEVGDETTNFILVHPSGKQFMLCEEEDTATCVGPFIRQEGT